MAATMGIFAQAVSATLSRRLRFPALIYAPTHQHTLEKEFLRQCGRMTPLLEGERFLRRPTDG